MKRIELYRYSYDPETGLVTKTDDESMRLYPLDELYAVASEQGSWTEPMEEYEGYTKGEIVLSMADYFGIGYRNPMKSEWGILFAWLDVETEIEFMEDEDE